MTRPRDHGGGLDAAIRTGGGTRADWLDLSTGINPVPYPMPSLPADAWSALPDSAALSRLTARARAFWNVPQEAAVLAAPGCSALIAQIPRLRAASSVAIPAPTYNEHAAAFEGHGWLLDDQATDAVVLVNPNNPDGVRWSANDATAKLTVIDESFCDVAPNDSLIALAARPGTIVLKSFGKFWGLAGLRLGFAIGDPALIAQLAQWLGPWAVSGPALSIGAEALADPQWADETRARLQSDADRLDALLVDKGAQLVGGTTLFRLYEVQDARAAQQQLASGRVLGRIFPYSDKWLRLGLPPPHRWSQLEAAL